jgi:hypothetical protein
MQCEKIYLPVLKAGEKMPKSEVYRILNLQSFEEETQLPRQNAGLYFYQSLDCLELAHEVSADSRKRPELYSNLGQP